MKNYLRALRAHFFIASIIPVALGAALAWHDAGVFEPSRFLLVLLGTLCIHAGANLSNDYWDHRSGADEGNISVTPFSGGSRVIQKGWLSPRIMCAMFIMCYAVGAAIGLYLNAITPGNVVLHIGLLGVLSSYMYTASPLKLVYRGIGELVVGVNFGPLVVAGSYYVQRETISSGAIWISIPVAFLIMAVLFINEFLDFECDRETRKDTMVVRLGRHRALYVFTALLIVPYLSVPAGVLFDALPVWSLLILITLPLAGRAVMHSWKYSDDSAALRESSVLTVSTHFFAGTLLCVSLLVEILLEQ
jgi:1,4-dihydroxy-2-naphthoate octaprenyltransferase